jgi:hypothetical protein
LKSLVRDDRPRKFENFLHLALGYTVTIAHAA